ncbi:MAG: Lrp/AsnC ligand binding domain-containing protein [Euryarchaeota archaeon]|nr:Lrp/AsnC ligand binding domain-containing protein [Euryarchaeota archaeon]MDE1835526.1 Lrp/AsnC ligand binding domain-containing protein [Euryarchaeota archaeon]MDE1879617.1 Lrp/AsnC ligand binding domain-containing protein [Euryarchaeota archaeon]MDE2043852.1 Lrp/AsnC ligand binding domain-containing protein [Thermoplasmata archaeon]
MNASIPREVLLYVKSRKQITSFYRGSAQQLETTAGGKDIPMGAASSSATNLSPDVGEAETALVLPDEQARAVALVEELAPPRGYALKIIDVSRAGLVKKIFDTHLSGVERYPVLVSPATGKRLEGADAFTEPSLLNLLPADLRNVRAFTQLKVDAHQVDTVRSGLLSFSEVKEVHLITGEWDMFITLEFPSGPAANKRQVFDFVLQKLAKIPGVQDFSTMIPEYSVTKFPI